MRCKRCKATLKVTGTRTTETVFTKTTIINLSCGLCGYTTFMEENIFVSTNKNAELEAAQEAYKEQIQIVEG